MAEFIVVLRSFLCLGLLSAVAWCECIPFSEAHNHLGETRCVAGKVFAVKEGIKGVHYLDFCEDYVNCPFTVVIFAGDLRQIGDVRQLQGKLVEIHGEVKEYDGRAEIILSQARQLKGEAARLPPLPKNYDVERRGNFSAGIFSRPKPARKTTRRQSKPIPTVEPDAAGPE
ncbi:MAG TPA: hypothetical protein VMH85_06735 [Terriglobales bacterium]|nr:hypothetical protein [Terriglobales bacterium]